MGIYVASEVYPATLKEFSNYYHPYMCSSYLIFCIVVVIDVGFGYVNSFDALDNRLATLDKMVTKEYRQILGEKKTPKFGKIIKLYYLIHIIIEAKNIQSIIWFYIADKEKAKKYKKELTEEEQEELEKKKAEKKKKKKEFSLRRFFKDKLGGGNDGGMFDFM